MTKDEAENLTYELDLLYQQQKEEERMQNHVRNGLLDTTGALLATLAFHDPERWHNLIRYGAHSVIQDAERHNHYWADAVLTPTQTLDSVEGTSVIKNPTALEFGLDAITDDYKKTLLQEVVSTLYEILVSVPNRRFIQLLSSRALDVEPPYKEFRGLTDLSALRSTLAQRRVFPTDIFMGREIWRHCCCSSPILSIMDLTTDRTKILSGNLGLLMGMNVYSDAYWKPEHKIIDPRSVIIVGSNIGKSWAGDLIVQPHEDDVPGKRRVSNVLRPVKMQLNPDALVARMQFK